MIRAFIVIAAIFGASVVHAAPSQRTNRVRAILRRLEWQGQRTDVRINQLARQNAKLEAQKKRR
ncbi:MAG: hypothetical protein QM817_20790 [Archangium sp.]